MLFLLPPTRSYFPAVVLEALLLDRPRIEDGCFLSGVDQAKTTRALQVHRSECACGQTDPWIDIPEGLQAPLAHSSRLVFSFLFVKGIVPGP